MSHPIQPVLLSSMLLVAAACSEKPADPRTQPPLVRVVRAGQGESAGHSFTGVVTARVQSDLGFRVAGKVVQRLVDTGQVVRRGQPLMRLDRTDLALTATARSGAVASVRARAEQTASDERRFRDLVSAGAVSASAYDQAKAAADAARAELRAAEAQEDVARNEAGYSVLLADADGVVVETLAEPGAVVSAGQPVVRLAHAGPREALVDLPETVRPAIGSLARATLFDTGRSSGARLRELSNAANPSTRTFAARYVLDGAAAQAPIGATVSVFLSAASDQGALRVPLSAIYDRGNGPGVWALGAAGRQVHWRPVRIGDLGEETATIVAGLRAQERFVALGAHLLHEGEVVRVEGGGR